MTTLEQIQKAADIVSRGGMSQCSECYARGGPYEFHVLFTLDDKRYIDGPFCLHNAALIRAEVLKFVEVEDAEIKSEDR